MSAGAVTLRCPSCGGVFLTLQQSGVLEICPHCAVSAPRESFRPTSAEMGGQTRTELPTKRVAISPVLPDVFFPQTTIKSGRHMDDLTPAPEPVPLPDATPEGAATPVAPSISEESSPAREARPLPQTNGAVRPFGIDPPLNSASAPSRKRGLGVISFLLLSCLAGAGIWLATKKQEAIVVPRTEPAPTVIEAPKPAPPIKTEIKPKDEVVLRARADDVHLANLAETMIRGLDVAKSMDDRLQYIDEPENHRDDVERFFASTGGKLDMVRIEPSVGTVIVLPSGEEEKLFKLTTKKCPDGAVIRLIVKNDKALLHWPLFEQSHDYQFDHFQKENGANDAPSVWFTVLCRLTQSFELKGQTKDNWLCLEAQGSLAPGGTGQVCVAKDTPAGRLLMGKMAWGKVYLTDLLIGKMEVDGQKVHVVLDCAGTQPAGRKVR